MCEIAKKIKRLLLDKNLTMKELAAKAGITPNHLSVVINGHAPGYEIREKIAFALNVPYESIWKPEPPKEK